MTPGPADDLSALKQLALICGVIPPEGDSSASADLLLAALRGLGVPLASLADAPGVHDQRRRELWDWRLEPVTVAWDGTGNAVLRMPADFAHLRIDCNMRLEDGDGHGWGVNLTDVPPFRSEEIAGELYFAKLLPLRRLPFGYHRMDVDLPGHHTEALVISATPAVYQAERPPSALTHLTPLIDVSGRPVSSIELRRTGYEALLELLRRGVSSGDGVALGAVNEWLMPRYSPGGNATEVVRLAYEVDELLALLCVESHKYQSSIYAEASRELPDDLRSALERRGIALVETDATNQAAGGRGYPNWRRRLGPAIEDLDDATRQSGVLDLLRDRRPQG